MNDRTHEPHFKMEFGPAFFAIVLQTLGGIVAATFFYASLSNTAMNTKSSADHLEIIVDRMKTQQVQTGERLVKVETNIGALAETVTRIDNKLDALRRN